MNHAILFIVFVFFAILTMIVLVIFEGIDRRHNQGQQVRSVLEDPRDEILAVAPDGTMQQVGKRGHVPVLDEARGEDVVAARGGNGGAVPIQEPVAIIVGCDRSARVEASRFVLGVVRRKK